MSIKTRLLGFAFASADVLVEIDATHVVTLAMGAGPTQAVDPAASWTGSRLTDLLAPASRSLLLEALTHSTIGKRIGPLDILLPCGEGRARRATLSAFMLPDLAPAISCAISYQGPVFALRNPDPTPMLDADGFLMRARAALNGMSSTSIQDMAFAFVDVPGLADVDGDTGERATARIEAVLQDASFDGSSAARLTAERFALLTQGPQSSDLAGDIRAAAQAEGVSVSPVASTANMVPGTDPMSTLRALRFAIEGCLSEPVTDNPELAFTGALVRTLKEAERFRAIVKTRDFALHYQPIVDLKTGNVHHFEALTRFSQASSPAPAIRMAEEMALIESFDLAVVEKALRRMRQPGFGLLKIAVNVSAASLGKDDYTAAVLDLTSEFPDLRRRLMIEVTESAALADIAAANRRLAALRQAGVRICIDDFGAGAASFDYLRGLSVDLVKIDGRFVLDSVRDERSRTLIAHLVELCSSLNLGTIAEMIETAEGADAMRALGVGYGQGWLFGRAEAEPRTKPLPDASVARRKGTVEAWG